MLGPGSDNPKGEKADSASGSALAPSTAYSQDKALKPFMHYRPLLFRLAYRMLGSVAEAEDVLQEVYLKWSKAFGAQTADQKIRNPKGLLVTMTTRTAMDAYRAAKRRRLDYKGDWLPEPVHEVTAGQEYEQNERISYALLHLMETLTPVERAVYILRDTFDYDYVDIAPVVGRREDNCRQIAARTRKKLSACRPARPVDVDSMNTETRRLLVRFLDAARRGKMDELVEMLHEDVVVYSDGGGQVRAALKPVRSVKKVARFFWGLARKPRYKKQTVRLLNLNNGPALLFFDEYGVKYSILTAADVQGSGQLRRIYALNNPEKMAKIPYGRNPIGMFYTRIILAIDLLVIRLSAKSS